MENIGSRNYATWWKPLEDDSHIGQMRDKPFSKEQEQAALDYAEQLFANKEYTQAFPIFQHLDEEFANPAAQFKLGKFYHEGLGVPPDYREAMRYYKTAASNGNAKGWCIMGVLYHYGLGVPQDYREAMRCYKMAADNGDAGGWCNMGFVYHDGLGVPQDYREAMRCYKMAADNGVAIGWKNIAFLYRHGLGVARDDRESMRCRKMFDSPETTGIIKRIRVNQAGLDQLKTDQGFKNTLIVLQRYSTGDMLRDFIVGKVSLEDCSENTPWIMALLKNSACLQIESGWMGWTKLHYLCLDYVVTLSQILQFGVFDDKDVSNGKVRMLLSKLLDKDEKLNFQKVDLRGADLRGVNLAAAELAGADLRGAQASDPDIAGMIAMQEKYMVLLEGQADPGSVFTRNSIPRELIQKIAESLY